MSKLIAALALTCFTTLSLAQSAAPATPVNAVAPAANDQAAENTKPQKAKKQTKKKQKQKKQGKKGNKAKASKGKANKTASEAI